MTIQNIKKQMLSFKDFYGGDLLDYTEIENAKSKEDLSDIIERHRNHMEAMLSDANSHLDNFKRKVELYFK